MDSDIRRTGGAATACYVPIMMRGHRSEPLFPALAFWLSVALGVAVAACGGVSSTGSSPDAGHTQASATSAGSGTGPSAPDGSSSGATDAAFSADCPASGTIDSTTTPWDGGRCIYIDVTTYDVSCHADSDCIAIAGGMVCNGVCPPNAAINVDGQTRYDIAVFRQGPGSLPGWGSSCASAGNARCVQGPCGGVCTWCPRKTPTLFGQPIPPGCPDAG
jgi:hypothetical protein